MALSLEAFEVGASLTPTSYWETSWGSYDRDYHSGKSLKITVRDVSRRVSSVEVDVYFIGAAPGDRAARFIYGHHHQTVALHGLIEVPNYIYAPGLKSRVLHLAALGERHVSGSLYDGWIVTGSHGGRVFDTRASSQTLLDIARANARDSHSLAAMWAAYKKRQSAKPLVRSAPKPKAAPSAVAPSAVATVPTVSPQYTVLRQSCEVQLPYGTATLAAGTRLEVLDQRSDTVKVRYANLEPIIPIAATDLAR